MFLSLPKSELKDYIGSQLKHFFPDGYHFVGSDVDSAMNLALERTEYCFEKITSTGYTKEGRACFSHLHSDQYSQFIYYLSNSLWNISQNKILCDKMVMLNKLLNGMFFTYNVQLPNIFLFGHPVGSVLGKANYSDFLVVLQNVTINTGFDDEGNPAPNLGKGLFLGAGASIMGNKKIGDRVSIGAGATLYNTEVPDDCVVIRNRIGKLELRQRVKLECTAQQYFNVPIH
ncbi:serine acetyltransferase [Paenibacillus taichungensis]|uniref:Serine acetyltransferase n=1 Tax=Paenibacillus taichungensis TaxID=484184 RepID=A0A329QC65_9BACL|nr:serine acetyltransferase [Paenibacillus taichungensis]RAW09973.1 serine acetyltransferase [Paenibacillus taichungensis]